VLPAPAAHAEDAPLRRAWDLWKAGDLDAAVAAAERATVEMPREIEAWKLYGYLLSSGGRKVEAERAYAQAAALGPNDAVAANNHAAVLIALGRLGPAEVACRRAIALRPGYADAQNNLGVVLERQGKADDARTAYRDATRADPGHAYAHNNLGALALRDGRRQEAEAALRRAQSLAPALAAPVLNLALLQGRDVSDPEIARALEAALDDPAAPPALKARAYAARAGREAAARRFEAARDLYLKALDLGGGDVVLLNNLAVAEDQLGLDRDAMLHLAAALELRPGLLVTRNNVGIVHVHRGSLALAEDTFRGILQEDERFHRAHYNLGVVLAAQGRLDSALRSFERAAELAPRDADVRYNLGLLRRRQGGALRDEMAAYREAIALDPGLAEARLSLGSLLADPQTPVGLRSEDEARTHLGRFLELASPGDDEGRAQARAWIAWIDGRRRR
jgi:Flp pilus assembly protein TadD